MNEPLTFEEARASIEETVRAYNACEITLGEWGDRVHDALYRYQPRDPELARRHRAKIAARRRERRTSTATSTPLPGESLYQFPVRASAPSPDAA